MEQGDDENIAEIVCSILEFVRPAQIVLFGSRARGTVHRYSDYDIALTGVEMDHGTEHRLKDALDIRLGIYSVVLINIDRVDAEFRTLIVRDGIVIYAA